MTEESQDTGGGAAPEAAASPPEPPAPDPGPLLGLQPGKVLQQPFRHPTKHFVMLPRGAALRSEVIDAIRLMGCERQAILCLGETIGPDTPLGPDVIEEGAVEAGKIERELRVVGQARDILALFLGILFLFTLALRMLPLVFISVLAALGWGGLHMMSTLRKAKIERIARSVDAARLRRIEGEQQLQEAAVKFGLLKHERLD